MTRYACPICGDPNAYPLWIDEEPPRGCPNDELDSDGLICWHSGAPRITNVTECAYQMTKARQAAEMRKRCPEAFDENGKMIPEMLCKALASLPAGTVVVV